MDKYDRTGQSGIQAITPIIQQISNNQQIIFPEGSGSAKQLQAIGMDMGFIDYQGQLQIIEVKTSNSYNTSIFIELITDILHARPGWFYSIQPDWLIHVCMETKRIVFMRWIPTRSWIETYIEDHRKDIIIQVDDRKSAVGLWVPLRSIALGIDRNNFGTFDLGQPELWQGKYQDLSLVA